MSRDMRTLEQLLAVRRERGELIVEQDRQLLAWAQAIHAKLAAGGLSAAEEDWLKSAVAELSATNEQRRTQARADLAQVLAIVSHDGGQRRDVLKAEADDLERLALSLRVVAEIAELLAAIEAM